MKPDYLTDDELEHLISFTEEQGLLQAPKPLKPEVLRAAKAHPSRRTRYRRYCLRVALTTAACAALLVWVNPPAELTLPQPTDGVTAAQQLEQFNTLAAQRLEQFNLVSQTFVNHIGGEYRAE